MFRSTLEEVNNADVLVHVVDRSNPVWKKQRLAVLKELRAVGCDEIPIVELWNKIDMCNDPEEVLFEAMTIDVEGTVLEEISADSPILPPEASSTQDSDHVEDDIEEDYVRVDVDDIGKPVPEPVIVAPPLPPGRKRPALVPRKNMFVTAGSVKTGKGMDDFFAILSDAISLNHIGVEVAIPYAEDKGLVTMIHASGTVESIDYTDTATVISAKVPSSLLPKLKPFMKEK